MSQIDFKYRPELPLVLRDVSLNIRGGEKIGIVGRTGAGKSSLLAMLLRLAELAKGKIEIDGIDISRIRLQDLRRKVAVIPQDPHLYVGTVRQNLDPTDTVDDRVLSDALKQVGLGLQEDYGPDKKRIDVTNEQFESDARSCSLGQISSLTGRSLGLDDEVQPGGKNFSAGEKQLLSLARALARRSKIIIIDEATSSVDYKTDAEIQKMIVNSFGDSTVIAIAHRLRTVLPYDKICVMDKGQIIEFNTPVRLFEQQSGLFRSMCDEAGIGRKDFEN